MKYIIGIDGGGTKTSAILADSAGMTVSKTKTEGSNIDKIGFHQAMQNILKAIKDVRKDKKISFIYISLAGGTQRNEQRRKKIEKYISQKLNILLKLVLVEGDEIAAFRASTDAKNGVVLIAGTGSIVAGYNKENSVIVGGWGHLWSDKGSAFWIGKKALNLTSRAIDEERSSELKSEIFKKLKIKNNGELMNIYNSNTIKVIASLSKTVDILAIKNNKEAKDILINAGRELSLQANKVIKKLNFQNNFTLILAGSVFNSKIVFDKVKNDINNFNQNAQIIKSKQSPVIGAVKLAIENLKRETLQKS